MFSVKTGKKKKPTVKAGAGWEKERERSARTQAAKSRAGRDIAEGFPDVADPARKAACRESFELFCRTYFPQTFNLPWSNDHRRGIDRIETAVRTGGLFGFAFPRGSGKTSLTEAAVEWATLYGFRQFPVVIGSDESSALEMLDAIKSEFENNEMLLADFPEVCYPIKALEGIPHRCNGQLFRGERTHIGWTAKEIVLPTIPGSIASGATIAVTGITGRIRGMRFKRPDGQSVRPDLVVIDDPQTDESARSPSQCAERIKILCGAVLGLAGPGKKIAGVMPCTVICPGDMADQILDRQKHPEWQGERTKLINTFPANDEIWERYRKIRSDGLRACDGGKAGTEFYRANREEMDRGAEAAWPVRFNPDELSAIQHGMNLRADLGEAAFFAEYQNAPIAIVQGDNEALTTEKIAAKANGIARQIVPLACTKLTAFIDVQKDLLFWTVCGWEDDFTGHVVDYGSYPDQRRDYYQLKDAKRTLGQLAKGAGLEAAIRRGLDDLAAILLSREWINEGGAPHHIERCAVDANWGESTDCIYKFVRESPHATALIPSHGKGIGASSLPFGEYRHKPGDRIGPNWRIPGAKGNRAVRHVLYDSNAWKSFVHTRLAVPIGGRGSLTIFGSPHDHALLADHLTAEAGIRTEGRGRQVTEWRIKPHRPDNHWFDCLAGACMAASMQGVALAETAAPVAKSRRVVSVKEMQANRKVWKANARMI